MSSSKMRDDVNAERLDVDEHPAANEVEARILGARILEPEAESSGLPPRSDHACGGSVMLPARTFTGPVLARTFTGPTVLEYPEPESPEISPQEIPGLVGQLSLGDDQPPAWTSHYREKGWTLSSLFPALVWMPSYVRCIRGRDTEADKSAMGLLTYSLKGDVISGLTVGCMLVPQCLAFALLAGLPLQTGFYSSFGPLVVYGLFGTFRQVQPGPAALMSMLTGQALDGMGLLTGESRMAGAALLSWGVGVSSVLLGMMRFGFIVDFMSHSVMNSFCSAAGVTIATSQLKHMLGIKMPRKEYWWQTVSYLVSHISEAKGYTCALGFSLLATLLALKQWKTAGNAETRQKHPIWRRLPVDAKSTGFRILKLIADLSSLLAVLIGWLWGFAYRQAGIDSVALVGNIESAGFQFGLPDSGFVSSVKIDQFIVPALVMTVVGYIETVAVGAKFASKARYEYDSNQELIALGLSNIGGAVMFGYPTTGSFSRTAVGAMFGATSLMSVLMASLVVLLAVYCITPVIELLPLSALAPLIIQGAISVINIHEFQVARRASLSEFLVMLATFVVSLALDVKYGLLMGFVLSVLKTMNELANPNLAVCGQLEGTTFRDIRNFPNARQLSNAVVIRMDARLNFTNSRKLKEFAVRAVQIREAGGNKVEFLVIDAKAINHVDLTGCETLESLAEALKSHGQQLVIANLKGPVSKCLHQAGVPESLRKLGGHLCLSMEAALAVVEGTSQAVEEDQELSELVRRVTMAKQIQYATSSPHVFCRGRSPFQDGNPILSPTRISV